MFVFLTINVYSDKDHSGLPTYYENILNLLGGRIEFKVVNISLDNSTLKAKDIIVKRINDTEIINIHSPDFMEGDPLLLKQLMGVLSTLGNNHKLIVPDYLFENYIDIKWLRSRGWEKYLFIHLLNRGMLNSLTKNEKFGSTSLSSEASYLLESSWLEWIAIMNSDKIICNSEFTKREVVRYYEEDIAENCEVYYSRLGVDKKIFEKSNIPEDPITMYFGRMATQKGMNYIAKDIKNNPDYYKKNPIWLAGEGELEAPFMKYYLYDGTVNWLGNLDKSNLIEKIKSVKYCLFPSIYEPWCLALNEALSMGKICIVSSNNSGMLEQFKDKESGFVFDFKNGDIHNFIEQLESKYSYDEFKQISENASRVARDNSDHVEELINILNYINEEV